MPNCIMTSQTDRPAVRAKMVIESDLQGVDDVDLMMKHMSLFNLTMAFIGPRPASRRGLTLLEALIASVILTGMVIATSAALSSSQQHGQFAEDQVQGALAAEAKLAEILADDYANFLSYDGAAELAGEMKTAQGVAYPDAFYRIGRKVTAKSETYSFGELGDVNGVEITVTAFDLEGTDVFTISRFEPEP